MNVHERRKRTLLITGLSMLVLIGAIFCIINYFRGVLILSLVELLVALTFLVMIYVVVKFPGTLYKACWFFIIVSGVFGLFAIYLPRSHVTVVVWSVLFYYVALFLLELRNGTIASTIFFILVTSVFLFKYGSGPKTLPLVALANVIILNFTAAILAVFYEKTRAETEAALQKRNREIEALSNLDGLTGLFNRRYFDRTLNDEWRRLRRDEHSLSLIMADIDHFKNFNDACGHLRGDDCIRLVADAIRDSIGRVSDVAVRYGGEEFAVLLPNTDSAGAGVIAGKIRASVQAKAIPHPASAVDRLVTISLGVATVIPDPSSEPSLLLAKADEALYRSKANGRNRVTVN